jgi:hypothetical protein
LSVIAFFQASAPERADAAAAAPRKEIAGNRSERDLANSGARYFPCGPQTCVGHIGNALPGLVGYFVRAPANAFPRRSSSPGALIQLIGQVFPQLLARFRSKKHPDANSQTGTDEKREKCGPFGTCHNDAP